MVELATAFGSPTPQEERALSQAGRELLLAQSSDWAFIITMATVPYAVRRTRLHLVNFDGLYHALVDGTPDAVDEAHLVELETRSPIFSELDWRVWRREGSDEAKLGGVSSKSIP